MCVCVRKSIHHNADVICVVHSNLLIPRRKVTLHAMLEFFPEYSLSECLACLMSYDEYLKSSTPKRMIKKVRQQSSSFVTEHSDNSFGIFFLHTVRFSPGPRAKAQLSWQTEMPNYNFLTENNFYHL